MDHKAGIELRHYAPLSSAAFAGNVHEEWPRESHRHRGDTPNAYQKEKVSREVGNQESETSEPSRTFRGQSASRGSYATSAAVCRGRPPWLYCAQHRR